MRDKAPDWVQYQDEHGHSYYYDPITKIQTYEVPKDADSTTTPLTTALPTTLFMARAPTTRCSWKAQMQASVNQEGGYFDQEVSGRMSTASLTRG